MIPNMVSAQSNKEQVDEAIEIIKGKSDMHPANWAIDILHNVKDTSIKPIALNALAMAYIGGVGVNQDSAKAMQLFEEAGQLGYDKAYHNLGMIYKTASFEKQNFVKAYNYFEKGALMGSLICCYDAGYMLYKGLGCKQDYIAAVKYFEKGLPSNNPSCLYMLGLCYRNGYGVETDTVVARQLLERAAMNNYRFAIEEVMREEPEVVDAMFLADDSAAVEVPASMPGVEPFLNSDANFCGNYNGKLVTYDWSGQKIIKERKLNVTINRKGEKYFGEWIQEKDTLTFSATMLADGLLQFENTKAFMQDRYIENGNVEYLFENASMTYLGNTLTGGLRLYSIIEKEPERPMYISLVKSSSEMSDKDEYMCEMIAYPMANSHKIEVRFTLPNDVNSSSIYLYSQTGMFVKHYNMGALTAGKHSFIFTSDTYSGGYVVSMSAEKYHGQTAILLKR